MFKNREIRVRVAKTDNDPVDNEPQKIFTINKADAKEMMILAAICVSGVVLSVSMSSAMEKILVHYGTKN